MDFNRERGKVAAGERPRERFEGAEERDGEQGSCNYP
jgi:hypothetical protein